MSNLVELDIPATWQKLPWERMRGTVMVLGAVDTGKSTLARYLVEMLQKSGLRAALLDGDPGQSTFGPPTTMTLTERVDSAQAFKPLAPVQRYFVGSNTPQGHMLPLVVGAARLAEYAFQSGIETLVYDTSGLVDPGGGGVALKHAKIALLQPGLLIAIQREQELEPVLFALRRSACLRVVDLYPSAAVVPRSMVQRREYRAGQFARYFRNARSVVFNWIKIAVFPLPHFRLHGLIALEDHQGLTLGTGIVTELDRANRQVTLLAPPVKLEQVHALRLGDVLVDPHTFHDERLASDQ